MASPLCLARREGTLMDLHRLDEGIHVAADHLLRARNADGFWEGRLSSSALSTATAVSALALAGSAADAPLVRRGVAWLRENQQADGGWGDTVSSPSNVPTTLLAVCALTLAGEDGATATLRQADEYLTARLGADPTTRAGAISRLYGADRTFAVPILMNCALAGLVPWEAIPGLPFELAAVPAGWYRALRLHVVSYALPALIAVGLALHAQHPSRYPWLRAIRRRIVPAVLRKLARIQPAHGGFLEATPLTSFVALGLQSACGSDAPVLRRCLDFLRASVRADGSWPIDTNLAIWLTTGATSALAHAGVVDDAAFLRQWIAARRQTRRHPYTDAAPGGWSWTHLPGGVPDADDTAGALLALMALGERSLPEDGVRWLLDLQNGDGGWPTFCTGWGQLPFDRSSADLTAHAIRALYAVDARRLAPACRRAITRGFGYLAATQRIDGAWVPLWFGNQFAPGQANPVFGTARVLRAYAETSAWEACAMRGEQFLLSAQNTDGGWGGDRGVVSSIEETALAVTALCADPNTAVVREALARGGAYLLRRVADGTWTASAPIGLYFASLWYDEHLYPIIWTVEALGSLRRVFAETPASVSPD